jgi:hypothetical protein
MLFVLLAASAHASSVRELGDTGTLPKAGCPDSCQAIGHVTGFQTQIGTRKRPFVVGHKGKLVAFTIKLGTPNASQTQFFASIFGTSPSARITILKRPKSDRTGGFPMKVLAQSEVFNLTKYLGTTPTFAFSRPLTVPAGATVALTVPTWAPAFKISEPDTQKWRGSRVEPNCGATTQAALQKVGIVRQVGCDYATARLLYTATFIPDPKPAG